MQLKQTYKEPKQTSQELKQAQQQIVEHILEDKHPLPARFRHYQSLMFNNMEALLSNTFPVLTAILTPLQWRELTDAYFRDNGATTPYFPEIAGEFVQWLTDSNIDNLYPFASSLAHYEWLELELDKHPQAVLGSPVKVGLHDEVALSPCAQMMIYAWPVETISPTHQPSQPQTTALLIYRNSDYQVKFIKLTEALALLLEPLERGSNTLHGLLQVHKLADDEQWQQLLRDQLNELIAKGAFYTPQSQTVADQYI